MCVCVCSSVGNCLDYKDSRKEINTQTTRFTFSEENSRACKAAKEKFQGNRRFMEAHVLVSVERL